jgi:tetratricopeptide (TPR) repeat protein
MRSSAAAACLGLVAAAAFVAVARGQQPAPRLSDADVHRLHGRLAWRRAAWRLRREEWQRAAGELELARKADGDAGKADFSTLYMLGVTYLRLAPIGASKQLDDADIALSQARTLDPTFPGLLFTDALRETLLPESSAAQTKARVELAIAKFDEFVLGFAHPEEVQYGQELQFLGHFYRGRSRARLPEGLDRAVVDLKEAMSIADKNGQNAPPEVVSLLAQVYKNLNQVDDAKREVADALARNPAEATNYYNLGQLLLGAQDLTGARSWFEAALLRRTAFPEARLALADVARKMNDPITLRRHLEAAKALQELNAKAGAPIEAKVQADVECGFGICWKLIGDQRADAGDVAGMREAFANAESSFNAALSMEPGCFNAVNYLIQIAARTGAPQSKIDELKRRLEKLQKRGDGDVESYRSTFC